MLTSAVDTVQVYVDMDTPVEQLNVVANAVREHIAHNQLLFGGLYRVFFTKAVAQYKLEMSVFFNFGTNGTPLIRQMCMKRARRLSYSF